jgi:hypothetical protein
METQPKTKTKITTGTTRPSAARHSAGPLLKNLQEQFVAGLTSETGDCGPILSNSLFAHQQTVVEAFSIYFNNKRENLLKAMTLIYPVCQRLVGSQCFKAVATQYIKEHVSSAFSLNEYGGDFSGFLAQFQPLAHISYLPAVASVEWTVHRISLGSSNPPFDWRTLEHIPADRQKDLILHRIDNSALYQAAFPVDRIWETNQPDFLGDDSIDLTTGEVYLFIWRKDFEIRMDRLSKNQWHLLHIIDGVKLGQLSSMPLVTEQNLDIFVLLPGLIKEGYIANLTLSD